MEPFFDPAIWNPEYMAAMAIDAGIPPPLPATAPSFPDGVPLPLPRPAEAGPGASVAGATPNAMGGLANMLKGVTPPTAPAVQRVGTPAAPRTTPIKGGELFALIQALGGAGAGMEGGLKLPSTLGQALGGR